MPEREKDLMRKVTMAAAAVAAGSAMSIGGVAGLAGAAAAAHQDTALSAALNRVVADADAVTPMGTFNR